MKPMLAATLEEAIFDKLRFPLLVSPKLDGYRATTYDGVAYSKNAKPLPNQHVQRLYGKLPFLDGELIVGKPVGGNVLGRTASGVRSRDGEADVCFYVFDSFARPALRFKDRLSDALAAVRIAAPKLGSHRIQLVPHKLVRNLEQFLAEEVKYLTAGYEGIMARDPEEAYKEGRSTPTEGGLWKLKRFEDGEAMVEAIEEGSVNTNEATTDELGRTKRSSAKAGKVRNGMVGTLIGRDLASGERIRIAPGKMSHDDRRRYHEQPTLLLGKIVHWRSFGYGLKNKARFPRFYGVRDDA